MKYIHYEKYVLITLAELFRAHAKKKGMHKKILKYLQIASAFSNRTDPVMVS